jgi:DNA-binding response OmpR family regulator
MSRTVVLADAAASVRDLVKALLEREDIVFVEAADATDALLAVSEHRPSLIFLDLDLPPCGGLEVLKKVRGWEDAPIVMLALRGSTSEARTLFAHGADEILLKPIDAWKLVAAAESALGPERQEPVAYPTPIARGA